MVAKALRSKTSRGILTGKWLSLNIAAELSVRPTLYLYAR
jgi:hypothetical protein